jgi:hypothetical protein
MRGTYNELQQGETTGQELNMDVLIQAFYITGVKMTSQEKLCNQLVIVEDALLDLAYMSEDEALMRETLAIREAYMNRRWALKRMIFLANGEKV